MKLLIVPYKHQNPQVQEARLSAFTDLVRGGFGNSEFVAPIVDQHFYAKLGLEYPINIFRNLIRFATSIQIYPLPGWQTDPLVIESLNIAKVLGIPVSYMQLSNWHMEGQYLFTWKQARIM